MSPLSPPEQQMLRSVYLVRDLTPPQQTKLLEACVVKTFEPGRALMKEGELGETMYLILDGEVDVITKNLVGETLVLAHLKTGEYFGEQAILPGSTGVRTATVLTRNTVRVAEVGKSLFRSTVMQASALVSHLVKKGQSETRQKLDQLVSDLLGHPVPEETLDLVAEAQYEAGQAILQEGEPSDAAYFVLEGNARAFRTKAGREVSLGRISEGQCFGELSVLENRQRSATVRAETRVRVMRVAADLFVQWHKEYPELQGLMQTLRQMYRIKGDDLVTFHRGAIDGDEAISSVRHLKDGRRFIATRVIDKEVFSLSLVGTQLSKVETVRYDADAVVRELYVSDQKLVGVVSEGSWEGLGRIIERVVQETQVPEWALAVFRERGELDLDANQRPLLGGGDVVCSCMQVTRARIDLSMAAGMSTVEAIAEETGASLVCGSCLPTLHDLVGSPNLKPLEVVSVTPVTEDIRAIRLRPCDGKFEPLLPGQHIVLRGRLSEGWVQRSYTLSCGAHEDTAYEVTVKREPFGLFSSWLCTQVAAGTMLRGTPPAGTFVLPQAPQRDVIFFAAGVGVTPALSMARTQAQAPRVRSFVVSYSASTKADVVHAAEWTALGKTVSSIEIRLRITQTEGRLTEEDIQALAADHPDALYMVCGPDAYMRMVTSTLRTQGISSSSILQEGFTSVGTGPAPAPITLPTVLTPPSRHEPSEEIIIPPLEEASVLEEAREYLELFTEENGLSGFYDPRLKEIRTNVLTSGTYSQTYDELSYGAKVAWRNSSRCIGRLYWHRLIVRDLRHLDTEEAMFEALVEHIEMATNGGDLRPVMSIFAPDRPGKSGWRIWNPQLIRYAGYRQPDGSIVGDPAHVKLTEAIQKLGWKGGPKTPFDPLPLVIQGPGREPKVFELPPDVILEVPISHPEIAEFAELALKWHALPAVSGMRFDCGGLSYSFAPFNGWYMATEIGARNFSDADRYNLLPKMAELMGCDTSDDRTLWRDRAQVELTRAVLHSFTEAGVTMVDHHTASEHFLMFEQNERALGRDVTCRWSWLVPPIGGSLCPIFHRGDIEAHVDEPVRPNYFWQPEIWPASTSD